jgi:hypothetical protein
VLRPRRQNSHNHRYDNLKSNFCIYFPHEYGRMRAHAFIRSCDVITLVLTQAHAIETHAAILIQTANFARPHRRSLKKSAHPTMLRMKSTIFWELTQCSLVEFRHRFGRTYFLHLYGRKMSQVSRQQKPGRLAAYSLGSFVYPKDGGSMFPKRRCNSTRIHGITSQTSPLYSHYCENLSYRYL